MSICKKTVKKFCNEFEKIENYQEAVSSPKRWDCHHRLEDTGLSKKDLIDRNMYYNRPASELVFLTCEAHISLHQKGKNNNMYGKHHTIETKKKMSDSRKGKIHSMESRKKISDSKKGNKNRYKFICPIKLTYMYCKQEKSVEQIAKELGHGPGTIYRHLKELNIPIRPAHRPSRK